MLDLTTRCTELIHAMMRLASETDVAFGLRSKQSNKAWRCLAALEDLRGDLRTTPPCEGDRSDQERAKYGGQ